MVKYREKSDGNQTWKNDISLSGLSPGDVNEHVKTKLNKQKLSSHAS